MLLETTNYCSTYCLRFATEVVKAALADTSTQSSSMLLSQYLGGTNAHFTYLMGLRNNNAHYLQLIDTFAPWTSGKTADDPLDCNREWSFGTALGYTIRYF